MGVSFETCLRRREDVSIRRPCYVLLRRPHDLPITSSGDVLLRRLDDVPSRRRWVFHLERNCDVAGTYRETLLLCRQDVLLLGGCILLNRKFLINMEIWQKANDIIYYSVIAPLILIILIFWLLTSVNLIFR